MFLGTALYSLQSFKFSARCCLNTTVLSENLEAKYKVGPNPLQYTYAQPTPLHIQTFDELAASVPGVKREGMECTL